MFSDGIRPGGDLTELDGVDTARSSTGRKTKTVDKTSMLSPSIAGLENSR